MLEAFDFIRYLVESHLFLQGQDRECGPNDNALDEWDRWRLLALQENPLFSSSTA
jgi:hypothetical protein